VLVVAVWLISLIVTWVIIYTAVLMAIRNSGLVDRRP
jgi:hypothetical protein